MGDNFGCGFFREYVVWVLFDYCFCVIIVGSYSDIFYMNCIKNGVFFIVFFREVCEKLVKIVVDENVIIDLLN